MNLREMKSNQATEQGDSIFDTHSRIPNPETPLSRNKSTAPRYLQDKSRPLPFAVQHLLKGAQVLF